MKIKPKSYLQWFYLLFVKDYSKWKSEPSIEGYILWWLPTFLLVGTGLGFVLLMIISSLLLSDEAKNPIVALEGNGQ